MIKGFFGKHRYLSNFYECKLRINGMIFRSAENAYQSFKTLDPEERVLFTNISPNKSKELGRSVQLRKDWDDIKLEVMYKIVLIKFSNTLFLRRRLILTGNEELIEANTWGDTFWGVCGNRGTNHLGKILMRVREEIYL